MKTVIQKRKVIALALAIVPLLVGCGSSSTRSGSGYQPGVGLGGCVPINSVIGFSGTNASFTPMSIRAGEIPRSQTYGQMGIGGAVAGGPYQRSGTDGTISMTIQPVGQGTIGTQPVNNYNGAANVNGQLQLSSAVQQDIYWRFGGQMPGTTIPGQIPGQTITNTACVSGIAMDLGIYQTMLYGGYVYLYMNNTKNGYVLYF